MQAEKEYLTGREIVGLRCESAGEYSLPDYNGDVKKILEVKTKVFPSGSFPSDDSLDFSGTVSYEVVYLDGDNNVTHAEFSTDYDAALRINAETYVDSDVETRVGNCNLRLVGPRKLSVKCSLESDVRLIERKVYEACGDAFEGYEPEALTSSVSVIEPSFASGEGKEYTEAILFVEGAIADEVEILLSDASFSLDSVERLDDDVEIKGSIRVTLLYKNADSSPEIISKEFPFEEDVNLIGAASLDDVCARVEIVGFKSKVEPTEDGVSLSVAFTATPKLYGVKNNSLDVILDAYLKERGTVNEHSDFSYTEYICSLRKEEGFTCEISLSEAGIESVGDIIYAEASPRVESCEINENGVKIDGEIKFSGIACQVSEENERSYFPIKFSVPFTHNVNKNCQKHENMRANCFVDASDVKIELNENKVRASCALLSSVALSSERRQRCLGSSYVTDEEFLHDDSVVTVYYPDASESLYEIAKRFHTSVASIAESNRLTERVFAASSAPVSTAGISKLIIR